MPLLSILEQLGRLEDVTGGLYPYRFLITPLAIAGLLAVAYLAYRKGLHRVLLRHRLATSLIGVPALVLALVVADYLVSPLWERSHLEELSPVAAAVPAQGPAPGSGGAFEAKAVRSGAFMGSDDFHFGRGDAQLIQTAPGTYILRLENFSVRNGPDLYVYLSEEDNGGNVKESLNLGRLKATDGAFNYEIPASVDVSRVKSAVVWCKQFAVLFAHAELMTN
jgi:hypothetical protein